MDMRFCIVSCLHFGGSLTNWNSFKGTFAMFKEMIDVNPEILIINGSDIDIALRRQDLFLPTDKAFKVILPDVLFTEEYVEFTRETIDKLSSQVAETVFFTPSENSIPNWTGDNSPLFENANKSFLKRAPARFYDFQKNDCYFIFLDSEENPLNRGRIQGEQLSFLRECSQKAKEYRHVFCFIHFSAWRSDCKDKSKWFEAVHPILKTIGAAYVFGACLHTYQYEYYDGIHYITSGSCGNNVSPPFPHFLVVNIIAGSVEVKVKRLYFPLLFPMTMQLGFLQKIALIKSFEEYDFQPQTELEYKTYIEALNHLHSGDIVTAQELWNNMKWFPCVQPTKVEKGTPEGQEHVVIGNYSDRPTRRIG